jgi:hypothetical protein
MSFIDSHLMDGEQVVFRTRLHPIIFLGPVLALVIGGLLAVHGNRLMDEYVWGKLPREALRAINSGAWRVLREGWHGYNVIGLFILVTRGGLGLLSALVNVTSSEFGVSTKRVLMKTGFLSRHSLETLLSKVESISVHQGLLGRLLGFGTIVVGGTGGSRELFFGIRAPLEFRRHVQEQIVAFEQKRGA